MGIDIYLKWDGMTAKDKKQQITGFSTTAGKTGYLRESYHGGPYATHIFFREAFEAESYEAEIPAAVMRERMDSVTEPARGCDAGHHFAQLMQQALNATDIPEDANPQEIMAQISSAVRSQMQEEGVTCEPTTEPMTGREAIYLRCLRLYPNDGKEYADEVLKSFEEFIALAEQKERETGQPCTVIASY